MLNPPRRETFVDQARLSIARHIEVIIFFAGVILGYLLCRLA